MVSANYLGNDEDLFKRNIIGRNVLGLCLKKLVGFKHTVITITQNLFN